MKIIPTIVVFAVGFSLLTSCGTNKETVTTSGTIDVPEVTGEFELEILKTGKSDAILLETENYTVVIDAGEKSDGKKIVSRLEESGKEKIDYLIISHFDQDHIGGVPKVLDGIEIGEIIAPDYEGNNSEYENYVEAVNAKGITPTILKETRILTLDDTVFSLYPPQQKSYDEADNDHSIVVSVIHGENRLLFAGDCETERLAELPEQLGNMEHIFLKVPHHGRYCDGMSGFIESVKPKYSVITCSNKAPADTEVLDILENAGCEVYQTVNGAVSVVSDGKDITVNQE
ncbi:MAG: MBL fold metallo-hydrolase [Oscillospiraceae bacterium]|nr:MBL fold metallo-hydrolase [Oscillospiraceae bacterium]